MKYSSFSYFHYPQDDGTIIQMFSGNIITGRLLLRPYEKGDISFWHRWNVDPEVQRFMPEPKNEPMSDEEQLAYLEECKNNPDDIYWTIVWEDTHQPIGSIALTDISTHHGIGEVGIIIGEKDYWSRGVAKESIKSVVEFATTRLRLRRITAEYEEGNIALRKALKSNGFEEECVCKESRIKDGKPINTIRMAFVRHLPEV